VTVRRRLDAELVRRGLLGSRRQAVEAIAAGRVRVGGSPAPAPTRLVAADEPIQVTGDPPRFVSRGGEKLAAALDRFDLDVRGLRALDAGASTGGFTRSTRSPSAFVQRASAGATVTSEMKERSATVRSTGPPRSSGPRWRTLVRSRTVTRGSSRNDQAS